MNAEAETKGNVMNVETSAFERETDKKLPARANEIVQVIEKTENAPELEMALERLAGQSLEQAKRLRDRMQVSMTKVLPELEGDSPLAKAILEANEKVMALNPNRVMGSFLYKLPIQPVRKWLVKNYLENFKEQNEQVMMIFNDLQAGRDDLMRKMIELKYQYQELTATKKEVESDIEALKEVQKYLDGLNTSSMDEVEKYKYEIARNKVDRKIRDLTTILAAIQQFFASIHQTMNTQSLLNEQIDSIMTVGPMVLQNAIMIHAAISKQKAVADAARQVQQTLSDAMASNAALIEQNAQDVAQMYNNPVIAMDKLKESYDRLRNAVETTRKAMEESSQSARKMTQELEHLQEEFRPVEQALADEVAIRKQATGSEA